MKPQPNETARNSADTPVRTMPIPTGRLALVFLAGCAGLAATMIALRPRSRARVVAVIEGAEADAWGVNRGEIADAARAVARIGRRYRARIEDESDDGSAGVARIGGLVTFVPGARRGQTVIIEVTSLRPRVANAALVRVESDAPPKPPPPAAKPGIEPRDAPSSSGKEEVGIADAAAARAEDAQPGRLFRVAITEASRKNPDQEGVARIGGLVVIVRGAQPGERGVIRILERRPRVAFAEMLRREGN